MTRSGPWCQRPLPPLRPAACHEGESQLNAPQRAPHSRTPGFIRKTVLPSSQDFSEVTLTLQNEGSETLVSVIIVDSQAIAWVAFLYHEVTPRKRWPGTCPPSEFAGVLGVLAVPVTNTSQRFPHGPCVLRLAGLPAAWQRPGSRFRRSGGVWPAPGALLTQGLGGRLAPAPALAEALAGGV